jgi:5-hydroxyisourate hydrolase-like protein (transthyretin family)
MSILVSVVDSLHGQPAEGVGVHIESRIDGVWREVVQGKTDQNGEFRPLNGGPLPKYGIYRLELDIDAYYATLGLAPFYAKVTIDFRICDTGAEHHIPVLITLFACAISSTR